MAGGRNILTETVKEVEQLLREYRERTFSDKVLGETDEKIKLLDKCLNNLYPHERELLIQLCVENVSERTCAKLTGLTRYRVRKEKERLLALTASVFQKISSHADS